MSKSTRITIAFAIALLAGLAIFLVANFNDQKHEPVAGLSAPDKLTLYSIDPTNLDAAKKPHVGDEFHGFLILGKLEVQDAGKRRDIATALAHAFTRGIEARCFWPRHAVRTVENGRTFDFLICFHCNEAETFDGEMGTFRFVGKGPKEMFNKILTESAVPLAPDSDDGPE